MLPSTPPTPPPRNHLCTLVFLLHNILPITLSYRSVKDNDKSKIPPKIIRRVCKRTISKVSTEKQLITQLWEEKTTSQPTTATSRDPTGLPEHIFLGAPVQHSCHGDLKNLLKHWLFHRMQLLFPLALVLPLYNITLACVKMQAGRAYVMYSDENLRMSYLVICHQSLCRKCSQPSCCGLVSSHWRWHQTLPESVLA